jgi:hypothetical protein
LADAVPLEPPEQLTLVDVGAEESPQPEVTVKVVVQVVALLDASLTVMVIVWVPTPTEVPAAGLWVLTNEPDAVQLSVAITPPVKLGTRADPDPPADMVWEGAHAVITGEVTSAAVPTVTEALPEQLPEV